MVAYIQYTHDAVSYHELNYKFLFEYECRAVSCYTHITQQPNSIWSSQDSTFGFGDKRNCSLKHILHYNSINIRILSGICFVFCSTPRLPPLVSSYRMAQQMKYNYRMTTKKNHYRIELYTYIHFNFVSDYD